jgi:hypothetical protein
MNSGLPSIIDAIFGKNDLDLVSLDEIKELINEFPSFNAAHFLLSKKLKLESHNSFEKESMKTALYFHNAFWLQMLLEDKNNTEPEELFPAIHRDQTENHFDEKSGTETSTENNPAFEIVSSSNSELNDNRDDSSNEINSEPISSINFEFEMNEENSNRVMSFDDLISKYNIELTDSFEEVSSESDKEVVLESPKDLKVDVFGNETAEFDNEIVETEKEKSPEYSTENGDEIIETPITVSDSDQPEGKEEIVDESKYINEVDLKESDHDLEAFDRPYESDLLTFETPPFESVVEQKSVSPTESGQIEKVPEDNTQFTETPISISNSNESDYEAFDGINEITNDDTAPPYSEPQKPLTNFDAKNSESILFTPYHMVDYFASQGIKLVLEDQPADNFGKQLKSFTDWLKVMKKIPISPLVEKTDEKETERIRHFAAHSLEDRDILTESMAEVLAKQGMYENAIALYQKLSLIYPPKSAYFASRIEQLKAAIP